DVRVGPGTLTSPASASRTVNDGVRGAQGGSADAGGCTRGPSGAQRPVRGSEGSCVAIADPSRRDTRPGPPQTAWRTTYGCHHSDAAQQCQWFASSRCRDQAQTTCGGSPVSWPRCAVHGETRLRG